MSVASHHAEWLSLVPHSGPFLSIDVLKEAFPNGLQARDTDIAGELRAAYGAWSDPDESEYANAERSEIHKAFVLFVLQTVLELDDEILARDPESLGRFAAEVDIEGVELIPDAVVVDGDAPLMLVSWVDPSTPVDQPMPGDDWPASPRERMAEHLREVDCSLGLVTDGERWTLVSRREDEPVGFATWWASLWLEERITLQAFRSLLGEHRFFTVPEDETLAALLRRSSEEQHEVTTKLGAQTLEAVEILVQEIDKLDREQGGRLLADVPEGDLYDAAVTVMMRLVFLFFAEENELLPTGEDLYLEEYAASSLRSQLQEVVDKHGEEVLETRSDAWSRLLATWRSVYAGIEHGDMRIAPYGGSLFDPDRYPFLEGRLPESNWREEAADPLPIDNRTVLHLLNALQTLEEGGQRRKLSFRALDVEQIGHVYEGMLDHTATRADGWVLGLTGVGGNEPEVPLRELESREGDELVEYLKDQTGRNTSRTSRWLEADMSAEVENFGPSWTPAFEGDAEAARRVERYAKFLREDSRGAPAVFPPGSVYVCDSSHRGATGTHYTPQALTEGIVRETLEPLVYHGPAQGEPEEEWTLRVPDEILDLNVADPACGSGAFLVQSCRYLADKLAEARRFYGELDRDPTEEDLIEARREIASRCLYGVDKNPMAVEMTKLSLWLVTLAEEKPFSFLDHALGVGDSLFGLSDLDQLRHWDLSGEDDGKDLFAGVIADQVEEAIEFRQQVESLPVLDPGDAAVKNRALQEAQTATERLRALSDLLVAPSLQSESQTKRDELRSSLLMEATSHLEEADWLKRRAREFSNFKEPFHWPFEFPEVFDQGGFDAIVGNPPFLGGKKISGTFGGAYREYLVEEIADGTRGSADLAAYFFRRAFGLIKTDGTMGLLAVNSISEGNTRKVGLAPIVESGGTIYSAYSNEPWPNRASVVTSRVHLYKGEWAGNRNLNDQDVEFVSSYLSDREERTPNNLQASANIAFYGSITGGDGGFILSEEKAKAVLASDEEYASCLFPYLNGRDLNQTAPNELPNRWVICFWDWSKSKAEEYGKLFSIVRRRVKPFRDSVKRKSYRKYWWRFVEPVPGLYHAIGRGHHFDRHPDNWNGDSGMDPVIVAARTSKYWAPTLVENAFIFSGALCVFASDSPGFLGLLSSCIHSEWAWKHASSLKLDFSYTPTDCFETFPLPTLNESQDGSPLEELGRELMELRTGTMEMEGIGLTEFYNQCHDPNIESGDYDEVRQVHMEIDKRALELYGWDDIELDHDFRDVSYLPPGKCHRFAVSEEARRDILKRLDRLNLSRYQNEVKAGLHGEEARREYSNQRVAEGEGASKENVEEDSRHIRSQTKSSDESEQSELFGNEGNA